MRAITGIGSQRHSRKLIEIAQGRYELPARQEAIYALWRLNELRAEPLFIQLSSALDSEEDYTRDMATEALGNTVTRLSTQWALAERLFDPSVSVRFSALCACNQIPDWSKDRSARVDDNRVLAELAEQVLRRH